MRIVTMGVLLGVVCATLGPATLTGAAQTTCLKRPGATLLSNSQVRVYETDPPSSEDGTLTRLWACRVGSAKRESLVDAFYNPLNGEQSYSSVRLAGVRVAFVVSLVSPDEQTTTHKVLRADMRSGRVDRATVTKRVRLVTSRVGGVAWIESGAVRSLERSGARTLDAGPVEASSLKRAGRCSVSWVRGGQRRTARLS